MSTATQCRNIVPASLRRCPSSMFPREGDSKKKRPARLQHPHAFGYPSLAPSEVFAVFQGIADPVAVVFAEIEWRIGEHQIHASLANLRAVLRQSALYSFPSSVLDIGSTLTILAYSCAPDIGLLP